MKKDRPTADGKWIGGLTPATPVAEAGCRALDARLRVVGQYLPLALSQPGKDPEYVHQLRVGSRRAVAALDIFSLCLPEKKYQRARKQLRRIRRAAGEARDWDVFLADLETLASRDAPDKRKSRGGLLLGYALGQRLSAQDHLRAVGEKYVADFDDFRQRTVAAVRAPESVHEPKTLVELALPMLFSLVQELNREAGQDLSDYSQLHRVRIVGKRLRYAMEVFSGCFQPPFRQTLYPLVEEMQDVLGRANDSHVAGNNLLALREQLRTLRPKEWQKAKVELQGILRFHQRRLPQERRRFEKWWQRWQEQKADVELAALVKPAGS